MFLHASVLHGGGGAPVSSTNSGPMFFSGVPLVRTGQEVSYLRFRTRVTPHKTGGGGG